jgi:hypothetical protein
MEMLSGLPGMAIVARGRGEARKAGGAAHRVGSNNFMERYEMLNSSDYQM